MVLIAINSGGGGATALLKQLSVCSLPRPAAFGEVPHKWEVAGTHRLFTSGHL